MESFREDLFQLPTLFIACVFFIIIFILNWSGYRLRKRIHKRNPDKDTSFGAAEGSLLGLMALLLAFSFGMAATKFETRRQVIIEEANLLNTAILRHQLYSDSARQILIPDLRQYVEARISYFDAGDNPSKIKAALDDAHRSFATLWDKTAQLKDPVNRVRAEQIVPVLINMDNMVTSRESGRVAAVPSLILIVLLLLVFTASFLTGFGTKPGNRNPVFAFGFAFMTTVVLYLVMELSRPRQGYINLQGAEQRIVDLRKKFPQ